MKKLTPTQDRLMKIFNDFEVHQVSELQNALPDNLSSSLRFHISVLRKIIAPSYTIATLNVCGRTYYQMTRIIR